MLKYIKSWYNDILEEIAIGKPLFRFLKGFVFCMMLYITLLSISVTIVALLNLSDIFLLLALFIPIFVVFVIALDIGKRFESLDSLNRGVENG